MYVYSVYWTDYSRFQFCIVHNMLFYSFLRMTTSIYSTRVFRGNLKRYDTDDGWVIAGSEVDVAAAACSGSSTRCGSPVRDTWTILSEGQKNVEMSYRTALAATPSTTCASPELREIMSPQTLRSVVKAPRASILSEKSSCKKKTIEPARVLPSSDDDANMYQLRKDRVAGSGSNKSRHNKKK